MTDSKLPNVDEVAELIGISRSYAYRVIRKLNEELTASGHYVVPRQGQDGGDNVFHAMGFSFTCSLLRIDFLDGLHSAALVS